MEQTEGFWLWVASQGMGARRIFLELLQEFQTPEHIFLEKETSLKKYLPGKEDAVSSIIKSREAWNGEAELQKLCKEGIHFCSCEHPLFPKRLLRIPDPPFGLYYKGRLPGEDQPSAAIVGARMCSAYGQAAAERFGRCCAEAGVQTISGMAYGVDSHCQKSTLRNGGESFAVLGSGIDVCYPASNKRLYEELQGKGGVLSESPPGIPPHGWLFPIRNRIISGLADVVIIIEAKEKSGSLITADQALEQGKDVFAVPGRMGEALSRGCNQLIRQGAGIVLSPQQVLEDAGFLSEEVLTKNKKNTKVLETKENIVYSCLRLQPKHLEEIRNETKLPATELMQLLLSLTLKGYVRELQKNYYIISEES